MPSFVRASSVGSATGTSVALTFSPAAALANGVVVLIVTDGALAEILAPTDNAGNTYTKYTDKTNASALSCSIWYVSNSTGTVTTVTCNFNSSQTVTAVAVEVGGGAIPDQTSAAAINSAAPAPGSITTGVPDTIIFGMLRSSGSITVTPVGYTTISETDSPAKDFRYQTVSVVTTTNPTWTLGSSAPHAVVVASFRASNIYTANSYPPPLIRLPISTKTPWQLWAVHYQRFFPPQPAPVQGPLLPLPLASLPFMAGRVPLVPRPIFWLGVPPPPTVIGPLIPLPPVRFPSTHPANLTPRMTPWGYPSATPIDPSGGGDIKQVPSVPRVPKPTDPMFGRRLSLHTELVADILTSLLKRGQIVQNSAGDWEIVP